MSPPAAVIVRVSPATWTTTVGRQAPVSIATTWKVMFVAGVPVVGVAFGAESDSWWAAPLQLAASATGTVGTVGSKEGATNQLATMITVASTLPRTAMARERTSRVALSLGVGRLLPTVRAAHLSVSGAIGRGRRYLRALNRSRAGA